MRISNLEQYNKLYKKSIQEPENFWQDIAENFVWNKKWDKILNWDFPTANIEWFKGAEFNITTNCLDRHAQNTPNKKALIWEPNKPNTQNRTFTYRELLSEVNRTANALKEIGIKKGDRICFYMPMVPELTIAVLACARIGAIHSVVFAGFSSYALAERIKDSSCKLVICSDYNSRGLKNIPVKKVVDEALVLDCPSVENVIVYKHTGEEVSWNDTTDIWWNDLIPQQSSECKAELMSAEDPLFILYTSGSTGKPKGIQHSCAGYMVYTAYSFQNVFQYDENDIYWCTADIGWITGHSYIIYGPLLSGATTVMFEGVPTFPDAGRFWQICEKYKVNQFYTAPTAIRALMAAGINIPDQYDLSSLKVIGSVGEPINEEAWNWYNKKIGRKQAPIVDTWWQTETGGILISPLPHITDTKPCHASYPLPGIQTCLIDNEGNELEDNNQEGLLCIKFPWPSMLRTIYKDHQRCVNTYFSLYKGKYFTGDSAKRDKDGRYRIIGRVDDVINVSGHRIGTAEVEDAINQHPHIIESAVVGYPHDIKGEGIFSYIILDTENQNIEKEILQVVTKHIGPIAKPDKILIVPDLPKTRSGKIMRRILRKIATKSEDFGDISTLLNPNIVEKIQKLASHREINT